MSLRVAHAAQLPPLVLPKRYQGLCVDDIPHATVKAVAREYLEAFWVWSERGLAPGFFGRSGTYKTYAACAIVSTVYNPGLVPSVYVQAGPEFAQLERRRFDHAYTEPRLELLQTIGFLVLDDITDVRAGSIAMDLLDGVAKQRNADGLPTLYTGNAVFSPSQPDALLQQFGAALTRRILEGTKGFLGVLR